MFERLERLDAEDVIGPRKDKRGVNIAYLKPSRQSRFVALSWKDVAVDLWIMLPDRIDWWGYALWLRTGPREANRVMIAPLAKGGMCPKYLRFKKGIVYQGTTPIMVATEPAMFELLRMCYVAPRHRNINVYRQARRDWEAGECC